MLKFLKNLWKKLISKEIKRNIELKKEDKIISEIIERHIGAWKKLSKM